jgi:hypothetical protein
MAKLDHVSEQAADDYLRALEEHFKALAALDKAKLQVRQARAAWRSLAKAKVNGDE